jgi:hypothetical protein
MYGPYLTEYEYDNLLSDDDKLLLSRIVLQPLFDVKSNSYRRKFGRFRNGEPIPQSITGYGSPHPQRNTLLPIIPVSDNTVTVDGNSESLTSDSEGTVQ